MHDIKYFFSIKIIKQSKVGERFLEGPIIESIIKKYYFLKFSRPAVPLDLPMLTSFQIIEVKIGWIGLDRSD
jgi:hypothetical protein